MKTMRRKIIKEQRKSTTLEKNSSVSFKINSECGMENQFSKSNSIACVKMNKKNRINGE